MAGRGKGRRKYIFCREYLKERNHLENLDLDGRRILKWLFKKRNEGVDSEYLKERNHLENLDLDGRRILKWLFKKRNEGVDRIDLALDRVDGVILWKE